jgi:hypothetical protein
VQNRGQGGSSDAADLPKGMSLEAAKEFVERLSTEQGTFPLHIGLPWQEDVGNATKVTAIVKQVSLLILLQPHHLPRRYLLHHPHTLYPFL